MSTSPPRCRQRCGPDDKARQAFSNESFVSPRRIFDRRFELRYSAGKSDRHASGPDSALRPVGRIRDLETVGGTDRIRQLDARAVAHTNSSVVEVPGCDLAYDHD